MRRTMMGLVFLGACGGGEGGAGGGGDAGPALRPGTLQGLLVDHLPRAVGSTPLTVVQAPADALVASGASALLKLGLSAAQVEIAMASGDGIAIVAVHTPGRGVHARLAAVEAEAAQGVVQEERLGRFEGALRLPAASSTWLLDAGDTALALSARDDATGRAAAGALAGAMDGALGPAPAGDPAADVFDAGPLQMLWLVQPPNPLACVGEPPGRLRWLGIAVDHRLIPRADVSYFYTSASGRQLPETGVAAADVTYSRDSFGQGSRDPLQIHGTSYLGGQTVTGVEGQTQFTIPAQHCLEGTWTDEDRILTIDQRKLDITASITTGSLCGATGKALSGTLSEVPGDTFQGDDLLVCNPQECVDAGLLPATTTTTFSAKVDDEGRSVDFTWTRTLFDTIHDDMGKLTSCALKSETEDRTFSIARQSFGPGLPF